MKLKQGLCKSQSKVYADYIETALNSDLTANNINLTANNNTLIQSSDLNTTNDLNTLNAGNLTIQDAQLSEYHYAQTSRSYRGLAKVAANINSTVIGAISGAVNYSYNFNGIGIIAQELDDPILSFLPQSEWT